MIAPVRLSSSYRQLTRRFILKSPRGTFGGQEPGEMSSTTYLFARMNFERFAWYSK
ncbi:hypothetical protein RBSH_03576 [Rhodopirellula baltica SH28]|uniref:Uncharacterized protein n=1 Tax=Rhodopirellula baltica SH28 TaxID=993517 RepID=K5DF89_RHOBT|nr:hypothetical protein RBSH_03576 [Rhodopirellula baltica SH28]